jgi:phosphatidate cytidylyltransferase
MLKTRVITALVLLAFLLPSLFLLPQTYWACLVALFVGVGAWEWGALLRWQATARRIFGLVAALVCVGIAVAFPAVIGATPGANLAPAWVMMAYGLAALFWFLLVPFWMRAKWSLGSGLAGVFVGVLVLLPTWLALVQLRVLGPAVLLSILAVVWVADIAAYFAGRKFGKHKLAPAISPGKTWEGVAGALIGVIIYGLLMRFLHGLAHPALTLWLIALLVVTAVSVIGDLFESMLKRQAGIKDSSNVLPGHGGVLDRIDSLTSTLPIVALFWLLMSGAA